MSGIYSSKHKIYGIRQEFLEDWLTVLNTYLSTAFCIRWILTTESSATQPRDWWRKYRWKAHTSPRKSTPKVCAQCQYQRTTSCYAWNKYSATRRSSTIRFTTRNQCKCTLLDQCVCIALHAIVWCKDMTASVAFGLLDAVHANNRCAIVVSYAAASLDGVRVEFNAV